jgi:hypothetical protein
MNLGHGARVDIRLVPAAAARMVNPAWRPLIELAKEGAASAGH